MVYTLDDTGSFDQYRAELLSALEKLVANHQSTPNVRVGVIKHGGPNQLPPRIEQVHEFVTPGQLSVSKIDKSMKSSGGGEWLDSSIAKAQEMIDDECPQGLNLATKPWCQSKVIVVLSDGDPGFTYEEYYYSTSDDLPEKLLDSISDDGIVVNTICIYTISGHTCDNSMYILFIYSMSDVRPRLRTSTSEVLLREMAEATGGKYYGTVR